MKSGLKWSQKLDKLHYTPIGMIRFVMSNIKLPLRRLISSRNQGSGERIVPLTIVAVFGVV